MFNNKIKILFALSFLVLGGFTAANAQIENGAAVRFDVSHSFVVRDKTLPAGKYLITPIEETDGSTNILKLQSIDGKKVVVFQTMEKIHNEPAKQTELVFNQAGDIYVLSEILVKGDTEGTKLEETRSEKRALAAAAVN